MSYAFIQDVPANEEIYRQIRAKLGDDVPEGLVAHVVYKHEGGLRYIDVWETQDAWARFRDERVEPAVGAVLAGIGIPHDHALVNFEDIEVVDCWLGEGAAQRR